MTAALDLAAPPDETSPEATRARPVEAAEAPRVPSFDYDAEIAIVEAALAEPDLAIDLAGRVRASDLFEGGHATIWRVVEELVAAGRPVSPSTVVALLRERGRLAQVGGAERIGAIIMSPATRGACLDDAVRQVTDRAAVRRISTAATRIGADGHGATDPAEYLDAAKRALDAAGADVVRPGASGLLDGAALAEPLPELDYLIADLGMTAGSGAPHLVAGYGFSGKTLALQALALALASGSPVWGYYRVPDPRRVLHVDLEQGRRLTSRRYQRLALAMGVDLASLGDALSVAVTPGLTLTEADAPRWREMMTGRDAAIIDSLRAATPGADENSSEIRAGLDMLGRLSGETGCRPIVIHHARKPSEGAPGGRYALRGSSAIYDGCDAVYVFSAEKGEPIGVETVKAREHGELPDDVALVIEDVDLDADPKAGLRVSVRAGELLTERREAAAEKARQDAARRDAEKVRRVLAERPGLATEELKAAAGLSSAKFNAARFEMGDDLERREERRGRNVATLHYLRSDGAKW